MITASIAAATVSYAARDGATVPLAEDAKAAAEQYLPGIVGEPVPAFTIDPSLASLNPGTRTFQIVSGDEKRTIEQHVVSAGDKLGTWRSQMGERTLYLHVIPGESVSIVSEQDSKQGVVTRFNPPQPLLIAGMNAGDEQKFTIDVKVYDLDDPADLEYEGKLDLNLTYIGAYKVTVPAGTFDAAALRWTYKGKVGPASIDDIQVRFVSKEAGAVATAQKRDLAAMLIYNENKKVGKVLKER